MPTRPKILAFASAALAFAGAAHADRTSERPELFRKLIDCRAITDSAQRLACYDAQVGALDVAEKKKDLVVVDRKEMHEARRSLFGFTLPKISLFTGSKEDEKDDIKEITSTVESSRQMQSGDWSLKLANDGGTWETNSEIIAPPKPGDKVRIAKAMLGSYLGQVGINHAVRFRRVN